eukprot:84754_1
MELSIEKEGTLEKKSRFWGIWRKRWTVLESTSKTHTLYISTYKGERQYESPTEHIRIDRNTDITTHNVDKTDRIMFVIENKNDKQKFFFTTASTNERDEWIRHLSKVKYSLQEPIMPKGMRIESVDHGRFIDIHDTAMEKGSGGLEFDSESHSIDILPEYSAIHTDLKEEITPNEEEADCNDETEYEQIEETEQVQPGIASPIKSMTAIIHEQQDQSIPPCDDQSLPIAIPIVIQQPHVQTIICKDMDRPGEDTNLRHIILRDIMVSSTFDLSSFIQDRPLLDHVDVAETSNNVMAGSSFVSSTSEDTVPCDRHTEEELFDLSYTSQYGMVSAYREEAEPKDDNEAFYEGLLPFYVKQFNFASCNGHGGLSDTRWRDMGDEK